MYFSHKHAKSTSNRRLIARSCSKLPAAIAGALNPSPILRQSCENAKMPPKFGCDNVQIAAENGCVSARRLDRIAKTNGLVFFSHAYAKNADGSMSTMTP